ncbi:hypothetical protein tb265_34450 [Gemmatimonadetes bacterium T265]|nr:hypothetical protein tb265_34450 [Gemmatimonadetes bacterium T265]
MTTPGTPYGPQTTAVRRFLQHFAALPAADWDRASEAHAADSATAAYAAADRDLARAVERTGRTAERDAVLGPLAQLVRVDEQPADADAPEGAEPPAALHPVAEAALAALLALVVRDVLPPRAFAALYAPFEATIPARTLDA